MSEPEGREQVLVVDDEPCSLELVSLHLAAAGYVPLTVDNGFKALTVFHQQHPRIIISDWLMPKMDGLDVCRQIRSLQKDGLVYFIMLTIRSEKSRLMEAFDAGVDDFLSKPFHEGELLARVRAGVRMVRMYDELNAQALAMRRSNAELSRLNEKLHQMACTDEITKLFNRRQAMIRLQEQWTLGIRYGQALSCAMIDIDHFKRVNDKYGHLKGDEILQRIGAVLLKSVRAADSVYRIGGDEFMVLLPMQAADKAFTCAERCRTMVESSVFADDEQSEPVTVTVGVSERTSSMRCPDDLLKAADKSLYEAKKQGRNRTVVGVEDA